MKRRRIGTIAGRDQQECLAVRNACGDGTASR
jgi:hypothetical protein